MFRTHSSRHTHFAAGRRAHVRRSTRSLRLELLEDRRLLSIDLVSVGLGGSAGNGDSVSPSISGDGRYVAFESFASNLVVGDTNGTDVFVRDVLGGTTILASSDSAGHQANGYTEHPSISNDARYVAFCSLASNLIDYDTNGSFDVFVKDLSTGATTLVSTNNDGGQGNGDSNEASISADGRYIAFTSTATNLVEGDTNDMPDVFVKDRWSGAVMRASTDNAGNEADYASYTPAISGDGRYVAFASGAANLVSDDTNGAVDVFVKDLLTGTTTRASTDSQGNQANGYSSPDTITTDGRYVGFTSEATNLVQGDTNLGLDAFCKDLLTGDTTRVSTDSQGSQVNWGGYSPTLSGDGRYAVFESQASNLMPGVLTGGIFVKVVATGAIELVEANPPFPPFPVAQVTDPHISRDAAYVAFVDNRVGVGYQNVYRAWNPLFVPEISLGNSAVAENEPAGSAVGTFATGTSLPGPFTYSLIAGEGDADNGSFIIEGDQLKTATSFDFETRSSYSIRVRSADSASVTAEKAFTISVTDVHDFASPGLLDPTNSVFYLRNSNSAGPAQTTFGYGDPSLNWTKLVGDWDGDGADSVGFFDPATATWYLRNSLSAGFADHTFGYGDPTLTTGHGDRNWLPLVGDWDGNGTDTIGFFDPANSVWYLRNALSAGFADYTFAYGDPALTTGHGDLNWTTIVGDWDGNGSTTIGFFDPANCAWYLRNALSTGFADYTFAFGDIARTVGNGANNWAPIVGDWDGNRTATIGFFDPAASTFMLRNSLTTGAADVSFGYGSPGVGWQPLTGCWYTGAEQSRPEGETALNAEAIDRVHLENLLGMEA